MSDASSFHCEARRFEGAEPCPSCASVGYCQAAHPDTPLQWIKRTRAIVADYQRLRCVTPDVEAERDRRTEADR